MNKPSKAEQARLQFEGLIQGLMKNLYGCCDDFVDANMVDGLRKNIEASRESGAMQSAGMGKLGGFKKNVEVRGDQIRWIEKESKDQYEMVLLKKVEDFIEYLNRTCFTSIATFESHYASYPQKSFYKKHLDQFKNDKGRQYSIILYLNENWKSEDGGMLSLYPQNAQQVDISPLGGRLVFFRSDEMEHEVHPSNTRERNSIAGWFKS